MNILKTVIRVLLVAICIGLFVFLSITLFKFIPKAINQLASATVSIGGSTKTASSTEPASTTPRIPTAVNPTEGGLNGVITQPNTATTTGGDIVILEKPTTPKTPTYTAPVYHAPTYTYQPVTYSGRKNISVQTTSIGIIDESGRFIATNTFRSTDTVSIRFAVLNTEDTPTGPWSMQVDMPALDVADRGKLISNIASIPGGSSNTVEARFDGINLSNGTPVVRIYTDVNNQVAETNENDNTLSITLNNVQSDGNYYGGGTGAANLNIVSIQAGRKYGTTFSPTSSFNAGESVTLKVVIRNTGGTYSTTWSTRGWFSGSENGYREFTTNGEQPIRAGGEQTMYYTIDNVGRGSNTFNITVDSLNNISESNEGDNTSSVTTYSNY